MKGRKSAAKVATRLKRWDEMVSRSGQGQSGKGIAIRLPNGKTMSFNKPGSESKRGR